MDSGTQRGGNSDIVLYRSVSNTKYNDVLLFNCEQKVIYTIILISNVKIYNINTFGNRLILLNWGAHEYVPVPIHVSISEAENFRIPAVVETHGALSQNKFPIRAVVEEEEFPPQLKKVAKYHDIVSVQLLVKTLF